MEPEIFHKKKLLQALKEAGLPYSTPNFIVKYEQTVCDQKDCPDKGEPYLVCPRDKNDYRIFTLEQINSIIETAKTGWFDRHWHWQP